MVAVEGASNTVTVEALSHGYHTTPRTDGKTIDQTLVLNTVANSIEYYGHWGLRDGSEKGGYSVTEDRKSHTAVFILDDGEYTPFFYGDASADVQLLARLNWSDARPRKLTWKPLVDGMQSTLTHIRMSLKVLVDEKTWKSAAIKEYELKPYSVPTTDLDPRQTFYKGCLDGTLSEWRNSSACAIEFALGTGNLFVILNGTVSKDGAPISVDMSPPPPGHPRLYSFTGTSTFRVTPTTFYAIALDPEEDYTLSIVNDMRRNSTTDPGLVVDKVIMWKVNDTSADAGSNGTQTNGTQTNGTQNDSGSAGSNGHSNSVPIGAVVGASIGGTVAVVAVLTGLWFFWRRKQKKAGQVAPQLGEEQFEIDTDAMNATTPFTPSSAKPATLMDDTGYTSAIFSQPSGEGGSSLPTSSGSASGTAQGKMRRSLQPLAAPLAEKQSSTAPPALPLDQNDDDLEEIDAGPIPQGKIPPRYNPEWSPPAAVPPPAADSLSSSSAPLGTVALGPVQPIAVSQAAGLSAPVTYPREKHEYRPD